MRTSCFASAFALGLFVTRNVFAQGVASPPLPDAECKALLGAPIPAPPSAQFPPAALPALRPYSVGQLSTQPSGTFEAAPMVAPKKTTQWYGWQTLIAVAISDGAALVGVVGTLASPIIGGPLIFVGVGGHLLSGPIVHWKHGHVGKGFGSLGLNLAMPLLGGLIGSAADPSTISPDGTISVQYAFTFAAIGYFVGPIIDIAALSTEEVTPGAPKGARQLLPSSVAIVPMIDTNRRGLSIVGQF